MKKILLFLTTVMLGLTVVGCEGKKTTEDTKQASQEATSEAVTTENDGNSDVTEYSIGDIVDIVLFSTLNDAPFFTLNGAVFA